MADVSKVKLNGTAYNVKDASVPSWAKQSSKPSYTQDEVGDGSTYKRVTSTEKSTWNNKGTYSKPSGGIPKSDLASAVQTSLGKADTALQSHQTIKQDGVTGATANRFGTCGTAAATAAKTVSITSGTFSLEAGARVSVKFTYANTAGTPTLNVNSTGAKNIYSKGSHITTGSNKSLLAGTVDFIYDGTQWHLIGNYIDTNTTYSSKSAASGGTDVSLVTTGEKYTWNSKGTYSKPSDGIPKSDLASAVQTSLGKADTALQSFTETDPTVPSWAKQSSKPSYSASEVGAAASSHSHGNIQNGGTLQTNDITIASGDKIVVTDSSDSSKIARTSISFDGSTATQALTKKGTWENFQKPISASNKLSSDFVDDTNKTHRFVTADQLTQIATNKTNILSVQNATEELVDSGAKQLVDLSNTGTGTHNTVTFTNLGGNKYKINGTPSAADTHLDIMGTWSSVPSFISENVGKTIVFATNQECVYYGIIPIVGGSALGYVSGNKTNPIAYTIPSNLSGALLRIYVDTNQTYNNVTAELLVCTKAAFGVSQKFVPWRGEANPTIYTKPIKDSKITSIDSGGYVRIGNLVNVNIRCTVGTAVAQYATLFTGLPKPVYDTGLSIGAGVIVCSTNRTILMITTEGVLQNFESTAIPTGILELSATYLCQ